MFWRPFESNFFNKFLLPFGINLVCLLQLQKGVRRNRRRIFVLGVRLALQLLDLEYRELFGVELVNKILQINFSSNDYFLLLHVEEMGLDGGFLGQMQSLFQVGVEMVPFLVEGPELDFLHLLPEN